MMVVFILIAVMILIVTYLIRDIERVKFVEQKNSNDGCIGLVFFHYCGYGLYHLDICLGQYSPTGEPPTN